MGLLPKNERRIIDHVEKKTMWIYGPPYSGKTYLANTFPDVLMLNTDGNIKFVDAPYVSIKDTMEGRVEKQAWENFKSIIDELAMNNNEFKTIVVDLLEDTYQYCRQFIFKREGYTHETDGGYGKGWSLVDDEFISTIKRLLGLDYNIILLSHQVRGDVTKKTGEKISTIEPNLRDKVTLKISGMVDFTGRFCTEGETRTIRIESSEVHFGGSRVGFVGQTIPATYEAICGLYDMKKQLNAPKVVETPNVVETPVVTTFASIDGITIEPELETPEKPRRKPLKRKDDGE